MEYNFSNSKIFTQKDKKFYTTKSGEKLELTWKPAIIDKIYREYIDCQFKLSTEIEKYKSVLKEKDLSPDNREFITEFLENLDEYKNKGYQIIIAALRANGKDFTDEWIDTNLLAEEKELIVQIIMDQAEALFKNSETSKKK